MKTYRMITRLRRTALATASLAIVVLAGCGDEYNVDDDAIAADPAVVTAERDAFVSDVDARLSTFDEELTALQNRVAGLPAEVREEINDDLEDAAEERQDVVALREEALRASTQEELQEARVKIREEFHDLDELLIEARLEAIEEYPEFRSTVEGEMSDLQRELDAMEAEADQFDDTARTRYESLRATLDERREAFASRLETTTEENWRDARHGLIDAWEEVKETFNQLPDPEVDVRTEEPVRR